STMGQSLSKTLSEFPIATPWTISYKKGAIWRRLCFRARCAGTLRTGFCCTAKERSYSIKCGINPTRTRRRGTADFLPKDPCDVGTWPDERLVREATLGFT